VSEEKAIEIWCRVALDEHGYPSSQPWEQLHAWPAGDGGYIIGNVPFFANDLAVGDIVVARLTDEGRYQLKEVRRRSGRSVFRIWLSDAATASAANVISRLDGLGCRAEITLGRLIAIDVPPETESITWTYVQEGKARGDWDVQVGYSAE
jgi:hypothetical protein